MMKNFFKKYFFEVVIILVLAVMYKDSFPLWFKEWVDPDSFYGLGFFVLGFNVYYIKTNFAALKEIPKSLSPYGIIPVLIGSLLYIIGVRASLDYLISFSLPVLILGVILSLYGYKTLFKLLIPIILLTLILPVFPLHRITMPLQLISAKLSSEVLKFLGLNSIAKGSILYINNFRMSVVAGCSGLKSLFSLLFVTIISSYLENVKLPKTILYLLLTIPFAIAMNTIRIVFTAFYGLYNGHAGLEKFHDSAGIVINIISILIIIFIIRFSEKREEAP